MLTARSSSNIVDTGSSISCEKDEIGAQNLLYLFLQRREDPKLISQRMVVDLLALFVYLSFSRNIKTQDPKHIFSKESTRCVWAAGGYNEKIVHMRNRMEVQYMLKSIASVL